MNVGAKAATGNILYFYIVIVYPSAFWPHYRWYCSKRESSGCFRMKFDYRHPLMISQWFSNSCRGGDQSLFITNELFKELKGFDENFVIYEDNEIISRLPKQFVVIPDYIITSARRYHQNGIWRLQYHFSIIHLKRRLGHYWKHATVL
jgi:GT2 family glycosyltransferase